VSARGFARALLASLLVQGAALGQMSPSAAPGIPSPSAAPSVPPRGSTPSGPPLLDIVSDSTCPAPSAVGALLREILGLSSGEHVDEVAHVIHEEGLLLVSLRAKDSRVLGERRLPSDGSCEDLARAAAVVLASWLTDVHPEFVPLVPAPPPLDVPPSVTPPASTAAPRPSPIGRVSSTGRVVPRGALSLRLGASLGLGFVPTPLALVGSASVAVVPDGSGIGVTLRGGLSTVRSLEVDGGRALYRRWPLQGGAVLRFAGTRVSGELEGGAALGWLAVAGRSFGTNHDASDATFGPFVTARAIGSGRTIQPFAELSGMYWARVTRVYGDPARPSVTLPPVELSLSVGLAVTP
jgi:hypothetical protein